MEAALNDLHTLIKLLHSLLNKRHINSDKNVLPLFNTHEVGGDLQYVLCHTNHVMEDASQVWRHSGALTDES